MNQPNNKLSALKGVPNIAIFASGAGSNAATIINFFRTNKNIAQVSLVVCNKPGAGVFDIAKENNIEAILLDKELFLSTDTYISVLEERNIDFIVLAGFLLKVPASLIQSYPNKIINIHPALLPKYGGKGMYGHRVHEAVIKAGEKESGITIHYVDEFYDHGKIILQATCEVSINDTAEILAAKIHLLEHQNYSKAIEQILTNTGA